MYSFVQGELIYVNYGTHDDFAVVKSLGVSTSGKVALLRVGKISNREKVGLLRVLVPVSLIHPFIREVPMN